MAPYEQVDILHGANGLMTGTGNPSATVNFIRKRPTYEPEAKVSLSAGSWTSAGSTWMYPGRWTDSGNVRGRDLCQRSGQLVPGPLLPEKNILSAMLAFRPERTTTPDPAT